MKTLALLATLFATSAQADMIKPATLDIRCVENVEDNAREITIVSNNEGSAVTINGKTYQDEQLIAGTEGGPAYLQAVNNNGGYNISISGGAFLEAFNKSTTLKGEAPAYVQLFNGDGKDFEATCTGTFSF